MTTLSHQELALYRQCLNEVLKSFHRPEMERMVGASYAVLMKEDAVLGSLSKAAPAGSGPELSALVRAEVLAEAIEQLGSGEFQARTGYPLDDGDRLLRKVKNRS